MERNNPLDGSAGLSFFFICGKGLEREDQFYRIIHTAKIEEVLQVPDYFAQLEELLTRSTDFKLKFLG
ncbi:hypothetical protein SM124_08980 [Bacillus sp. 31A1R]|uniref:Uncharacterized protein n=1 Tax=Robertmurraya mangrovi TaxID=3098077 RepID=A0ABU5IXL2_9BACI|nr:hypothetical protein [Bacillus sp. 31A1R]MDZ5471881.1 hypothetical protein [Bacillus sp. 31A1R]